MRFLLTLFLALASQGWGAPIYVQSAVGNGAAGVVTFTASTYTTSTNSNRCLVLHSADYANGPPTSVSWNGQAFTQHLSWPYSSGNWFGGSAWSLTIGSGTSASGELLIYWPTGGGGNNQWAWTLTEFSGTNQTTPVGGKGFSNNSGSTSTNVSLTTQAADSTISASAIWYTTATSITSTTGTYSALSQSSSSVTRSSVYSAPAATAGSYYLTFGFSATPNYGGGIMLELAAAPIAAAESLLSPVMWNSSNSNMFPQQRQRMR